MILIQGGAGGVAGFAIQLAKYLGATVVTTTSAANVEYVRSLGADHVIDYNAEDFTKVVSNCDVVFDTVGGEVQTRSYIALKPGGRLVWVAPAPRISSTAIRRHRIASCCQPATVRTWSG
jgi:NADPH:quinone reductase-like Zn-dependent oxidoreductase